MLQNIRDNAQGTIAKVIVFLIILTFAIFGTDAIIQSFYGEPEVAQVNGEPITQAEFEKMVERKRRQIINQMGAEFDPSLMDQNRLRKLTLDEAVQREVVWQAAEKNGLVASEAQIDAFITQWPAAQRDGRFDPDQFRMILANIGLTPLEFRRELRTELAVGQLQGGVIQSAFVADADVLDLLRLERQTRDFRFLTLDGATFQGSIVVDDEEISQYYETNQERYRLPERVTVDFIEIGKADLEAQITLDDAEIEAQYQAESETFASSEQRRASHILLEVSDAAAEDEILSRLQEIRQEILSGKDFKEAAREYSQDIGTSADGGALGLLGKGVMGDDAFDTVLFGLEEGQTSEPVKTVFGYHIIKLDGISATQPPSRDEAVARIRRDMMAAKTESLFVETNSSLVDLTYSAADLQEASTTLALPVKTSPPFSREGGEGIWSNPKVLEQAFADEVLQEGHNSEVIEIGKDKLIVFRKNQRLESVIQTLDEVRDQVKAALAKAKAKELILAEVKVIEAAPAESVGGDNWQTVKGATRNASEQQTMTSYAFSMPIPQGQPVIRSFETPDGFVVVALDGVADPDVSQLDDQRKAIQPLLAGRIGNLENKLYLDALQNSAEIDRNP
jgi:peptidyl-prolyl cis-trans isomerase D